MCVFIMMIVQFECKVYSSKHWQNYLMRDSAMKLLHISNSFSAHNEKSLFIDYKKSQSSLICVVFSTLRLYTANLTSWNWIASKGINGLNALLLQCLVVRNFHSDLILFLFMMTARIKSNERHMT